MMGMPTPPVNAPATPTAAAYVNTLDQLTDRPRLPPLLNSEPGLGLGNFNGQALTAAREALAQLRRQASGYLAAPPAEKPGYALNNRGR